MSTRRNQQEAVSAKTTEDLKYFSAPIVKVEKGKDAAGDECVFVYGKVTNDELDLDEQIVDKGFARKGLDDWFKSFANVRQMHSTDLHPAGKGMELEEKPDGFWLKSAIYEPTAMKLAEKGVYSAYSVGIGRPRIIRDQVAKNGRIVDGRIVEVSLVDYPALPSAKFIVVKSAIKGDIVQKFASAEAVNKAVSLAAMVDLWPEAGAYHAYKREWSPEAREQAAKDGRALDDGSFPIETEEDLKAAVNSVGRASDYDKAKSHIIERAKALGKTALLPEEWGVKADGGKVANLRQPSFAEKRLHDISCAAFSTDVIFEHYPEVERQGFQMTLKQGSGLMQKAMLDAAHTNEFERVAAASMSALSAGKLAGVDESTLREAHTALHKDFSIVNPGVSGIQPFDHVQHPSQGGGFRRPYASDGRQPVLSPSPGASRSASVPSHPDDAIQARDFGRGYQSDGRQPQLGQQNKAGGSVVLPNNADGQVRHGDMTRGPLTAGHQNPGTHIAGRGDPSGKPQSGAAVYAQAAANQCKWGLQELHDHILSMLPNICPMEPGNGAVDPSGHGSPKAIDLTDGRGRPQLARSQAAGIIQAPGEDDNATAVNDVDDPDLLPDPGEQAATNAIPAAPITPRSGGVESAREGADSAPQGGVAESDGGEAPEGPALANGVPGEKVSLSTLVKRGIQDLIPEIERRIEKKYAGQIAELREQVDELGREPDPRVAPNRGGSTVTKSQKRSNVPDLEKRRQVRELEDERDWFKSLINAGDPEMVAKAMDKVEKLQGRIDAMRGDLEKIESPTAA